MSLRIFAPAKINLTLEVGRPRPDGRHPLQSAVAFADIGDWVEAEAGDDVSLRVTGPFLDALRDEQDNLVLRAARALQKRFDVSAGARLTLEKNLPVASGIGGGSSDAAAALKALNALWQLSASEADLKEIAALLGADIPVCLAAESAFMTGAGETLVPLDVPPLRAVLINPLQTLSTGAVYKAFDAANLGGGFVEKRAPLCSDVQAVLEFMRASGNDLAAPAESLAPCITEILSTVRGDARVLYAALSGSGATCFAIVGVQAEAQGLAEKLSALWPGFWIAPTLLGGASR
jgi:4-diphosphocytidyl-2-C-methyl-D-erythritol kinase